MMEVQIENIISFLREAHANSYASGDASKQVKETDNSTTFTYDKDNWHYHDNYFGGEPYGGREVVFFDNKPIWMMTYYGTVASSVEDFSDIYAFLQEALKQGTDDYPLRGPQKYEAEGLTYSFYVDGTPSKFVAMEIIKKDGKVVYSANFAGGFVDIAR